ncbi:MAG: hypothetical protein NVS3B16_17040 [Vulcanimicrobiaceae bacterium]
MLATLGLVALTGASWGLTAPITRLLFDLDPRTLDGASLTVARASWCALAWLPAFAALAWRERRSLGPAAALQLLLLGGVWGPGVMGLYAVATQRTALAHVVFAVGLTPLSAGLLTALFYGGTIDGPRRLALALGALGAAMLALGRSSAHATLPGDACLLAWVVVFGLYATLAAAAVRTLSPLLVTAGANVSAGALLAAAALVVPAWRSAIGAVVTHPHVPLPFFGAIVLLAGLVGPLGYTYALGRAPVAVVTGGIQYISIGVGTAIAIAHFHEPFGAFTIAAGAALAASLGVSLVPARRPRAATADAPAQRATSAGSVGGRTRRNSSP